MEAGRAKVICEIGSKIQIWFICSSRGFVCLMCPQLVPQPHKERCGIERNKEEIIICNLAENQ